MNRTDSLALLDRATTVHVAGSTPDGTPMLRTLHHVVLDGFVAVHCGPKGSKLELLGREVVIGTDEPIATLPSTFFHPQRACPATTWFRSVQVQGTLEEVADVDFKARVLQTLMERLQPEGGYVEVDAESPMYRSVVAGLVVARVSLDRLTGRDKRGFKKKPEAIRAVLSGLWKRGGEGDLAALEDIRRARPDVELPAFLVGPDAAFHVWGGQQDAAEAGEALAQMYWNAGCSPERMKDAHLGSSAWVFARGADGAMVATARACGDGAKGAWIYDVWVDESRRGTGLGRALMELLMDHPNLRGVRRLHLSTKDADGFYLRLGFGWSEQVCETPWPRLFLSLDRGA
jgi:nitroimidazol reductase NimA-like FMN-containing flavoprotein (pyridoxamine 5'-phosphate oxidase superfamily)/GNAT superfamily N-acetyltransferase